MSPDEARKALGLLDEWNNPRKPTEQALRAINRRKLHKHWRTLSKRSRACLRALGASGGRVLLPEWLHGRKMPEPWTKQSIMALIARGLACRSRRRADGILYLTSKGRAVLEILP